MRIRKEPKRAVALLTAMMAAFCMTGCGQDASTEPEQAALSENAGETERESAGKEVDAAQSAAENAKKAAEDAVKKESAKESRSDDEGKDADTGMPGLQYIEQVNIKDYYGDKSGYEVYVPAGYSDKGEYLFFYDHGITFKASTCSFTSAQELWEHLETMAGYTIKSLQDDDNFMDMEVSEIMENGSDKYQIISARREDFGADPYWIHYIFYMDAQEEGKGVLWEMNVHEAASDMETDLIIEELAQCYRFNLDEVKMSEERMAVLGAKYPSETILWFNATYAPLTYSNSCDWKLVGGMEATDYNAEFNRAGLSRSWDIEDRESALETVERLIEKGHKDKCRECMEELEEMGILDVDEETFMQELADSGIEENLFRYVIAYYMHQEGLDADYIAAWDLCRANQLYADFYICGYMTYEEAMDASLENSLVLQKMYPSWEDMVNAYMLGFQFWQSDPCLTEYSPTMQRYQCYEELLKMEDGPYTLDWNMELVKSW